MGTLFDLGILWHLVISSFFYFSSHQVCRGYGDTHGDPHGYGYGVGMGIEIPSPRQASQSLQRSTNSELPTVQLAIRASMVDKWDRLLRPTAIK